MFETVYPEIVVFGSDRSENSVSDLAVKVGYDHRVLGCDTTQFCKTLFIRANLDPNVLIVAFVNVDLASTRHLNAVRTCIIVVRKNEPFVVCIKLTKDNDISGFDIWPISDILCGGATPALCSTRCIRDRWATLF